MRSEVRRVRDFYPDAPCSTRRDIQGRCQLLRRAQGRDAGAISATPGCLTGRRIHEDPGRAPQPDGGSRLRSCHARFRVLRCAGPTRQTACECSGPVSVTGKQTTPNLGCNNGQPFAHFDARYDVLKGFGIFRPTGTPRVYKQAGPQARGSNRRRQVRAENPARVSSQNTLRSDPTEQRKWR